MNMRHISFAANIALATGLTLALFHIGALNLRSSHVHAELNICAADLHRLNTQLAGCEQDREDLNLKYETDIDIQTAIEKSTKYCRG